MDRELLVKVLGKLGSDADPEVLVAARTAVKMLREAQLQWSAVIAAPQGDLMTKLLAIERRVSVSGYGGGYANSQDFEMFQGLRDRYFDEGALDAANTRRLEWLYSKYGRQNADGAE